MDIASEEDHVVTTFRKIRAERMLYKNMRFHLTDLSDAIAFVDSCAKAPRAVQQAASQEAGRFTSEGPNDSKDDTIQRVVEAIAFECGIDAGDFQDSTCWEDVGIDSLMQLGIAAKMREDFGLQVDISIFMQYPTVGLLKSHLATAANFPSNKP
jgi:acyl carrier protein